MRLALTLATAAVAGSVALAAAPAIAEDSGPAPTVYRFALPGSVTPGASEFSLPGDLMTKKSRRDKDLGKVTLTEVAAKAARLKEKGRSVMGTVTINGKVREMKGIPVAQSDGTVKVRIAQARGTRTLVLPRKSSNAMLSSCPPGYVALMSYPSGTIICMPA